MNEHISEYSVEAFRFYAEHKAPDEKALQQLRPEAVAAAFDIYAVIEALRRLRPEAVRAVEEVYFKPIKYKGDVSALVVAASFKLNYSERQIYNLLRTARLAFAFERGLRLE